MSWSFQSDVLEQGTLLDMQDGEQGTNKHWIFKLIA